MHGETVKDEPEFESRAEEFDRLLTRPGRLWGHPASNPMGTGPFPGRWGGEAGAYC